MYVFIHRHNRHNISDFVPDFYSDRHRTRYVKLYTYGRSSAPEVYAGLLYVKQALTCNILTYSNNVDICIIMYDILIDYI